MSYTLLLNTNLLRASSKDSFLLQAPTGDEMFWMAKKLIRVGDNRDFHLSVWVPKPEWTIKLFKTANGSREKVSEREVTMQQFAEEFQVEVAPERQ